MNLSKSNKNVLRKSALLLLVTAVPALAWAGPQDTKKTSAPAPKSSAPTHTSAPTTQDPTAIQHAVPKPRLPRRHCGCRPPRPRPIPTPGTRLVSLPGGGYANIRPDGSVSSIHTKDMDIEHNLHGGWTIVSERNGVRTVTTGRHGGYVQQAYFDHGGHHYYQRTYCDHGVCRAGVYRGYYWRGRKYYGYYPAYWHKPGFYAWGYRPWRAPVYWGIRAWGWGGTPWYGFYGGYFAPYPYYASPAYWLTDYLIASSLQAAYAAQAEAHADVQPNKPVGGPPPQTASNAVTLSPEVKEAIAEDVKAQLAVEQAAAGQGAPGGPQTQPSGAEVPPALDPARTTFVVDTDLDVAADGQECSLTGGDVLARISTTPDENQQVNTIVTSSKKKDCAAGKQVAVKVDDLQEMQNHFRQQLDEGMKSLASKQGTGGMPKAPDAGTAAWDVPPPSPDNTAAKALQDQQQAADQTEDEVKKQASIEKGQTPDQVQAAMGKPDKIVNLGTKQIYVYQDLKVTFLNGKVFDMQYSGGRS